MSSSTPNWIRDALGAGVVNAIINGVLGWFAAADGLPMWGLISISGDLVATAFGVAFGTCLGLTWQTRGQLARGRMAHVTSVPLRWRESFARWPEGLLHRCINMGVLGVLIFAPLPLLALILLDVSWLAQGPFTVLKTALAFVEGALVAPVVMLAVLSPSP